MHVTNVRMRHVYVTCINRNLIERNSLEVHYGTTCHVGNRTANKASYMHRTVHFDGVTNATCLLATTAWHPVDAHNNAPKHTQEACKRSKYRPAGGE